jgi:hypothetical protein
MCQRIRSRRSIKRTETKRLELQGEDYITFHIPEKQNSAGSLEIIPENECTPDQNQDPAQLYHDARNQQSWRFGPPTSDLRPPTSDLRPPTSDLRPPTSDLRPPTSDLCAHVHCVDPIRTPKRKEKTCCLSTNSCWCNFSLFVHTTAFKQQLTCVFKHPIKSSNYSSGGEA